tara:strand:+ start:986 stop:1363 length:378 start_codon:yes stop_codon:yes gene_type:complete
MNLKNLAKKFNYLNEEIQLTSEQDKELLDIILKYVKDSDDAEAIIQDYIDGTTNRPDIQDGSFAGEFEAWKRKHNIREGSCGYTVTAKGEELDTPGGTRGMPANTRTMGMMREFIKKEIKHLFKK